VSIGQVSCDGVGVGVTDGGGHVLPPLLGGVPPVLGGLSTGGTVTGGIGTCGSGTTGGTVTGGIGTCGRGTTGGTVTGGIGT